MRWKQGRRSSNIEDRRGSSSGGFRFPRGFGGGFGGGLGGGTGGGFPRGGLRLPGGRGGKGGLGGLVGLVVMLGILWMLGVNPIDVLTGGAGVQPGGQISTSAPGGANRTAAENELADFVSAVLADTEDTWQKLFSTAGGTYQEPRLVLFTGSVQSACGFANAAVGPFYCPGDRKIYLDLSFFRELHERFGAPGDFARAYVVAHEVGHHVQTLLGISERVQAAKRGASKADANAIQVRMELQADCLAGVWAHHAEASRDLLEEGDIEEGLRAAQAIGDDTLQRQAQGYIVPDSFTHGTADQRSRWFKIGFRDGKVASCDTFSAGSL